MKGKNPYKAAAALARSQPKPATPTYSIQTPTGGNKWAHDASGHHLLGQWIATLGNYDKADIKQSINQMIGGQGKNGTNKFNGAPIQHASAGAGEGSSGACSIWFAESPEYVLNVLAVGHHVSGKASPRYEIDWTCGTGWPGGAVGDTVGPSGSA